MDITDAELGEAGWKVVSGGLRAFMASSRLADLVPDEAGLKRLGLILGGDVSIRQERIAIASTAMPEPQADDATFMSASTTAMVEARDAKGSGGSVCTRLEHFTDEPGREAADHSAAARDRGPATAG